MNLKNHITVLEEYAKKINAFGKGVCVQVSTDIDLGSGKLIHSFSVREVDYLICLAGLVKSSWDSSKFQSENKATLPELKFDFQSDEPISKQTMHLLEVRATVCGLYSNDKKESKKLSSAKECVNEKLDSKISESIGFVNSWLIKKHPFSNEFITQMEGVLLGHIEALKKWKLDKEKAARDLQKKQEDKESKLKEDCIKFLVANGMSESVVRLFDAAFLFRQVESVLTEKYKKENPDYSSDKQYDEDGRFYEIPEVSYSPASGAFTVRLEREYH